jgi:hypothetical protein
MIDNLLARRDELANLLETSGLNGASIGVGKKDGELVYLVFLDAKHAGDCLSRIPDHFHGIQVIIHKACN